jgi:hypothetical protein
MTPFSFLQITISLRGVCAQRARVFLIALFVFTGLLRGLAQDVMTGHNDMARTGVQPRETVLTPASVSSQQFGKVFSFVVIGDVYAQPLYLSQYTMIDGVAHNVLIVATAQDYIYAFDADGNNPAQGYLWRQTLLGPGETWASASDVNTVDINPNIGIIGTPVIDRTSGTIYVVAKSKISDGTSTAFYQRLHALNVADGLEKLNGPTVITASVPGTADNGTAVAFDSFLQNQRAALLLAPTPGVGSAMSVVIAWGSHGDKGPYHGWIMAYDAADVSHQNGAWTTTPNGIGGGVWMSGGGVSSDANGNIFAASGNGLFDANVSGGDFGDSAFRLTLSSSGLQVMDSFTPADQLSLDTGDHDMGMSAVLLIPTQAGPLANLAVTSDKTGTLYLMNRDRMGGYGTPENSAVQSLVTSEFGDGPACCSVRDKHDLYDAGVQRRRRDAEHFCERNKQWDRVDHSGHEIQFRPGGAARLQFRGLVAGALQQRASSERARHSGDCREIHDSHDCKWPGVCGRAECGDGVWAAEHLFSCGGYAGDQAGLRHLRGPADGDDDGCDSQRLDLLHERWHHTGNEFDTVYGCDPGHTLGIDRSRCHCSWVFRERQGGCDVHDQALDPGASVAGWCCQCYRAIHRRGQSEFERA